MDNTMNTMDNTMDIYNNYVFNNYEDNNERQIILDMLLAIIELNLCEWVQNFEGSSGFMFSGGQTFERILNHKLVYSAGHSGASAAWCARHCQHILQNVNV